MDSEGNRVINMIDRYGRDIPITIENDKAYFKKDGITVPLYSEVSVNEDGTKTYILDLNTRIPTFDRMTLKESKSMVQKVKDMLLEKMANISGLTNVAEPVKALLTVLQRRWINY
jgi:hypothetical protein